MSRYTSLPAKAEIAKRILIENLDFFETNFTDFFIEESCGSCTPCRTLPVLMKDKLIKIIDGKGVMQDLMDILLWR